MNGIIGKKAHLQADIEELCIQIPEEVQLFPRAVENLNKAIYGLVQSGRHWNLRLDEKLRSMRYKQ